MFHDFVVKGIACYKKCFKAHSIRECAYNETLYDEAVVRRVGEGERERERDRQTDSQTDRQTDRQTHRQTDRQTDRQRCVCTSVREVN